MKPAIQDAFFQKIVNRKGIPMKSSRKKLRVTIPIIMTIFLMLFALAAGCGSKGSAQSDTPNIKPPETPDDPGVTPDYLLNGMVYMESGVPVSGAEVFLFSDPTTTTTDETGAFSMDLSQGTHTLLASKNGFIDSYQVFTYTSDTAVEKNIMVQESQVTSQGVLAKTGTSGVLVSNMINSRSVKLDVPAQKNEIFKVGTPQVTHADFSLDYININDPLPVPLPSPDTLAPADVKIAGKQAPSVLVSIKPALLEMDTSGTLYLPNPHDLVGMRILRFDPGTSRWIPTGQVADETPLDGTNISMNKGGVYGLFFEEVKTCAIKGVGTPGALVFVADQVVKIPSDGNFYIQDVPVPPNGSINIKSLDPATGSVMTLENVPLFPNQIISNIDLTHVQVNHVEVESTMEAILANGNSWTTITASAFNEAGLPVPDGFQVNFKTSLGHLSASSAEIVNGEATVRLISPTTIGTATVTATVAGVSGTASVRIIKVPASFSVSASSFEVKTDNSDSTEISVTVLDQNNSAYEGVPVHFSTNGGKLFSSVAVTNSEGTAIVSFSSGTANRANRTAEVIASIGGEEDSSLRESIFIQVVGTYINLTPTVTDLGKDTLSIQVLDAGDNPIYNAQVEVESVDPDDHDETNNNLAWEFIPPENSQNCYQDNTGKTICSTDPGGEAKLEVTADNAQMGEDAMLKISSMGATKTQMYKVVTTGAEIMIIDPERDTVSMHTGETLQVKVHAPERTMVRFATTVGTWQNGSKVYDASVFGETATAVLHSSSEVGLSTVQVMDVTTGEVFDLLNVAISAPTSTSAKVSVQASSGTVAVSQGETKNAVDIVATVTNAAGQVVGDAPVSFSFVNTVGGGESISPALVLTNAQGQAKAVFTSGSVASGADGIQIRATVIGTIPQITGTVKVVIGGTAASIAIGMSSKISAINNDTAYELPMSLVVTDANGNPVPETEVTLGVWPTRYATGFWYEEEENDCSAYVTGVYDNEDGNRNLILNPGEDENQDGKLTPPSSAAGTVPAIVTTDENGTATFTLQYLKDSAAWIEAEVRASTLVSGSETESYLRFWLAWLQGEECNLPHSPYNSGGSPEPFFISMIAKPAEIVANGSSTSKIRATVMDITGNFIDTPVEVHFKTNSGSFSSSGLQVETTATTVNGVAEVTLYSAQYTATATVTATVEREDLQDLKSNVQVKFVSGDPSQNKTKVTAEPLNITADGKSTSTIRVRAYDDEGNLVQDGMTIIFEIISGGGHLSAHTALTSGGIAEVVYTAPETEGTARIQASLPDGTPLDVPAEVTLIKEFISAVNVNASSSNIPADGKSITYIIARVLNLSGEPAKDGTIVTFSTTAGSFTNQKVETVSGVARAELTSSTNVGTAYISATTGGVTGNTVVNFIAGGPSEGNIQISVSPSNLTADGVSTSAINVTIRDDQGNIIQQPETLTFSISPDGGGTMASYTMQTENGKATNTYIAPNSVPQGGNEINITVTTTGGASASEKITLTEPQFASLELAAEPETLPKDGTSRARIMATLKMPVGEDVPNDTPVYFTILPTLNITATQLNDESPRKSTIVVNWPSEEGSNLSFTEKNSGNSQNAQINAGVATYTYTESGSGTDKVTIKVETGGGNYEEIGYVNIDLNNGKAVATATRYGVIDPVANTTDGVAIAYLTSGTIAGTVTIRAGTTMNPDSGEVGGIIAEIDIEYTAGSINVTVIPVSPPFLANSESRAKVTAILKDESGRPVEGVNVQFKTRFTPSHVTLGSMESEVETSNSQGVAETYFRAGKEGGTAEIIAEWEQNGQTISGSASLVIPDPPAFLNVLQGYPDPTAIDIKGTGGQSTSQIIFEVKDSKGDPVADGYRIDFSILAGPNGGEILSPPFSVTSDGGKVSTVLRSGFKSGPISIKAQYHNDSNVSTSTSQIAIKSGQPVGEEFGISAEKPNIAGLGITGVTDQITISAADIYGNAIPDQTAISFKTYNMGGVFVPGSAPTTDGFATSTFTTTASPVPEDGIVPVTAEAVNGGRTTHITSLAVVPQTEHDQIVYAGTDGGGVYKSLDSGATWFSISRSSTNKGQNWIAPYVNDIAVDPENYNLVYAATGYLGAGRIYRSFDGGLNWVSSRKLERFMGVLGMDRAILCVLCDDNGDGVWAGTDGGGLWYAADGLKVYPGMAGTIFTKITNTALPEGAQVNDIIKVEKKPVLYAATSSGVYMSSNNGHNWQKAGYFPGESVNVLALHPSSTGEGSDVLYAGTEDAGVWVSYDSGQSWENYKNGLGSGLSASVPVAKKDNTGSGTMSNVTVYEDCLSENWEVRCVSATDTGASFSVTGSISGRYNDYDISGGGAYTITDVLSFTIEKGIRPFETGDTFTFSTTRDEGKTIEDILVDETHNWIYAITYFWGALEPHAVGNVYSHKLEPNGYMADPSYWKEANSQALPQYDPPDDTTLFAQHAMAFSKDGAGRTTGLFLGGEGINHYKATDGLASGEPEWQKSTEGLTNLIMARMPIILSGAPIFCAGKSTDDATGITTYEIYLEDVNGNTPPEGRVILKDISQDENKQTVYTYTFSGFFTDSGHFFDLNDISTDWPIIAAYEEFSYSRMRVVYEFDGEELNVISPAEGLDCHP